MWRWFIAGDNILPAFHTSTVPSAGRCARAGTLRSKANGIPLQLHACGPRDLRNDRHISMPRPRMDQCDLTAPVRNRDGRSGDCSRYVPRRDGVPVIVCRSDGIARTLLRANSHQPGGESSRGSARVRVPRRNVPAYQLTGGLQSDGAMFRRDPPYVVASKTDPRSAPDTGVKSATSFAILWTPVSRGAIPR